MIVRFVDIGEIVDRHGISFRFIICIVFTLSIIISEYILTQLHTNAYNNDSGNAWLEPETAYTCTIYLLISHGDHFFLSNGRTEVASNAVGCINIFRNNTMCQNVP